MKPEAKTLVAKALSEHFGEDLQPGQRSTAAYAASYIASRGRRESEAECQTRSPFQRDRDRVLHATAFRRLTHKTQVFIYHEGDHYRTRLTHSLEVAQIARTVSRQLRLDEDLAEGIALAHDLGHSPFGHAGERALDHAMHDFGGFDHNAQSLRVVTVLERKYAAFDGLNLTWETLEGLAKHNGPIVKTPSAAMADILGQLEAWRSFDRDAWASGEAQVASLADDIAYLSHDVDDGLRAGLLHLDELRDVPLAGPIVSALMSAHPEIDDARATYEVTRRMITAMISDLVTASRKRLRDANPSSPEDIRHRGYAVVSFSGAMADGMAALKSFLFDHVYHHERVLRVMGVAEGIVRDLFVRYLNDVTALPGRWRAAASHLDRQARARVIADFVSGQTDRYAIEEYKRLFDASPDLR